MTIHRSFLTALVAVFLATTAFAQESGSNANSEPSGSTQATQEQQSTDQGSADQPSGAQSATDPSAQEQDGAEQQAAAGQEQPEAQESLKIYFDTGAAAIGESQSEVLDQAARLFREGNPYVMILSGGADTVGPADLNLDLSLARASSVADGLESRGIPVDRLQVVGRGNTDLPVQTGPDVAERQNRVVEINWR